MNILKLILMILGILIVSLIGGLVGMFIGLIAFPLKILDSRSLSIRDLKETILPTDPNKDQI